MKTKNFKKEKGITLVALIITIIVLLILAMVSISLIINSGIVTKSKSAVDRYSDEEVQEMIKTGYSEYKMSQFTGQALSLRQAINNSGLAITDEDITGEGPWTITVGEKSYTLAVNGTVTPNSSGGESSTPITNAAYAVGDVVTLGGEDFYVIEASDASTTTVKLLAKYNVKTESGEGQYTQTTSANTLRFDDNSSDYTTSEIKTHVDAYKTALETRMGKTTQEVRLMTKEEVVALGGEIEDNNTFECPEFINETGYWLGSYYDSYNNVWRVSDDAGDFNPSNVSDDETYGLRPVVVVLKSNI